MGKRVLFSYFSSDVLTVGGHFLTFLTLYRELRKRGKWVPENLAWLRPRGWKVKPPKVDLVQMFLPHPNPLSPSPFLEKWAKGRGLPVVRLMPYLSWKRQILYRLPFFSRFVEICNLADVLVCESPFQKESLVSLFPEEKLVVIPTGVPEFFLRGGTWFERKFGVKDYLLFVGRIEAGKNVLNFVKAVSLLEEKFPVVLVGPPSEEHYFAQIKRVAREEGISLLQLTLPYGRKLASAFASARLVVLPSKWEAYGRSLVEGVVAGKVGVATHRVGSVDLLGEAVVKTGWSAEEIARGIERALRVSPPSMELRRKFLLPKMAEAYEKLYDSLTRK